jgi:hypothetical protein
MTSDVFTPTGVVLNNIAAERFKQDERWGEQNHPDGTSSLIYRNAATRERWRADMAAKRGALTWRHILTEEVYEAFAETDPEKLRAELVQVAAVAAAWVEAIDRRSRQ